MGCGSDMVSGARQFAAIIEREMSVTRIKCKEKKGSVRVRAAHSPRVHRAIVATTTTSQCDRVRPFWIDGKHIILGWWFSPVHCCD